jgi:DNA-binding transcriptional LysR family regulator
MSQPAVSKALRRLREVFDDALFVRGSTGIVPTPRAHEIVSAARPHLHELQDGIFKGDLFEPAASTRPITLAISDIAEMAFYPSIIQHFRLRAPKCPIVATSASDDALARGLESGDIDVAAGYHPSLALRNFRQRRLSRHGFACLLRAGHPAWRARLTPIAYSAAQHVAVRREGGSRELLDRFIERKGIKRTVTVYTAHGLRVPFLVMDSDLVATLPYAVVTRFASLSTTVVAALPPFDLGYDLKLHWHRRFDDEPRSKWIREQLAAVFKGHQWLEPPVGPEAFL